MGTVAAEAGRSAGDPRMTPKSLATMRHAIELGINWIRYGRSPTGWDIPSKW